METNFISFEQVKQLYPNEWILFGNPQMKNTTVTGGVVLFHSKDKKVESEKDAE